MILKGNTIMSMKLSKEESDVISSHLGRIDHIASEIQSKFASWGLSFDQAKSLVHGLDRVADEMEKTFYGEASLRHRQVEVLKSAKVIQQDSDEKYMGTFNSPTKPIQTDADEKYMAAYKDDQSQAVNTGKSTSGRALAP